MNDRFNQNTNRVVGKVKKDPASTNRKDATVDIRTFTDDMNKTLHAMLGQMTGGLAPQSLIDAYTDWAFHLATSPGKRMQLMQNAMQIAIQPGLHQRHDVQVKNKGDEFAAVLPQDRRFRDKAWQQWPYSLVKQSFLMQRKWWHDTTTGISGVTPHHEDVVEFASKQLLDMMAPSNFMLTNPVLLERTLSEGGANLLHGAQNFMDDWQHQINGRRPAILDEYTVGEVLALTPGKVVLRNHLIELIQYEPSTEHVRPEPILITPAWIMKYYILDLSPENSLVKYLTDQGFTVFMISWKNPGEEDRDLSMQDYRIMGPMAALDAIGLIVPDQPVHAIGYCLGGTLMLITAAAMARDADNRLKSLSLLAAQSDFTEAGELTLFVDKTQLSLLDDMMWKKGYLDGKQMSATFALLRSNDLIWSRMLQEYLLGERVSGSDMMAWNADTTRMPYRMHSQYLHSLFLDNQLAEGSFEVDGAPITLNDIQAPIFAVATEKDHVAPWHSVYKIQRLTDTEVTFVLVSGGHNGGIVSAPGHPHRHYQMQTQIVNNADVDAEAWIDTTPHFEGSWWPALVVWLEERSGPLNDAPKMGAAKDGISPICDAPGTYVLQG